MAGLMLVGLATVLASPEPAGPEPASPGSATATTSDTAGGGSAPRAARWLREAVYEPFAEFLTRPWALLILLRSEEHTSELQSLMRISYAVFCLKKKINDNQQ